RVDRTPASRRSAENEVPRTEQKYPCRRAPSASRSPGGARSSSRRRRCRDALVDAQRVLALEKRRLRSGPEDAGGCARAAETDGDVFGEPGRKAEGEGADERVAGTRRVDRIHVLGGNVDRRAVCPEEHCTPVAERDEEPRREPSRECAHRRALVPGRETDRRRERRKLGLVRDEPVGHGDEPGGEGSCGGRIE